MCFPITSGFPDPLSPPLNQNLPPHSNCVFTNVQNYFTFFKLFNFIYLCPSDNCVTMLGPVQLLSHTISQIFLLNCYLQLFL